MKGITVYTVILAGYDNLHPPAVAEPGVRYVCITDEPIHCPPWEIRLAWRPYESDRRNSRIPKILAHLYFGSEFTIYHDGCFSLQIEPSRLVESFLNDADIALYRHPCRTSIYEEHTACERDQIGDGPEMNAQVERYRSIGIGPGLWAGGFIARRNSQAVAEFNETWWREFRRGCERDQIALPAAIFMSGLKVHTVDADILMDTDRLAFHWHVAWEQKLCSQT